MDISTRSLPITSTGAVATSEIIVAGIIVNSHSSGTLALYDAATGAYNLRLGTYTFPTGSSTVIFPVPMKFNTGIYAVVGGTLNCVLLIP